MTAPLFVVDSLQVGRVVVTGDEGHHAADVQRLQQGEHVLLSDGRGSLGNGVIAAVARGSVEIDVSDVRLEPAPQPRLVVAQGLAKGGRDEDAVESMTEVGVDGVIGWQAARSIAKWTDRAQARWTATARAAAKQSRRAWVPDIEGPMSTRQLAERAAAATLAVVLHEDADEPLTAISLPASGEVLLVVGPEGGVSPEELAALTDAGARKCRLGPHVLRTSTAGVAAISVLSAMRRWR